MYVLTSSIAHAGVHTIAAAIVMPLTQVHNPIRTIDKLGDGHDQAVIKWKNSLEQLMASNEVCRKTILSTDVVT